MPYHVKEVYYTIQGEGMNLGRPAVFCRFNKCNLWSGRQEDREKAICQFCDTDFIGIDGENGAVYQTASELSAKIAHLFPTVEERFVVFTGGEPLLHIDDTLILEIKKLGFEIAVETNGTVIPPQGIDWITVSPKLNSKFILKTGAELKVVYPQEFNFFELENLDFKYFLISPMILKDDELQTKQNIELASKFCLMNPKWRLTYQCHKIWGIN